MIEKYGGGTGYELKRQLEERLGSLAKETIMIGDGIEWMLDKKILSIAKHALNRIEYLSSYAGCEVQTMSLMHKLIANTPSEKLVALVRALENRNIIPGVIKAIRAGGSELAYNALTNLCDVYVSLGPSLKDPDCVAEKEYPRSAALSAAEIR